MIANCRNVFNLLNICSLGNFFFLYLIILRKKNFKENFDTWNKQFILLFNNRERKLVFKGIVRLTFNSRLKYTFVVNGDFYFTKNEQSIKRFDSLLLLTL